MTQTPARSRFRLPRAQRRTLLVLHIASSVGWLGVSLALLTLALTGRLGHSAQTTRGAYWAMHLFADLLVAPLSLTSLLTGILLGLGTQWGLTRQRWVLTKLVLTTIAAGLSILALRAQIGVAYHASQLGNDNNALRRAGANLVIAGSASICLYLFVTALSVFKPWGPTRRGRQHEPRG